MLRRHATAVVFPERQKQAEWAAVERSAGQDAHNDAAIAAADVCDAASCLNARHPVEEGGQLSRSLTTQERGDRTESSPVSRALMTSGRKTLQRLSQLVWCSEVEGGALQSAYAVDQWRHDVRR